MIPALTDMVACRTPDAGLINGVGRFVGGPEVPFAVINVVHGKRYRSIF